MKDIMFFVIMGAVVLAMLFLCTRNKGVMTKEMPKKVRLAVRILGCCVATLAIWGSWYGSFSAVTFILMVVIGIVAGSAFHKWVEHVREKYKDEPLTEKEKQKFLKWLSMGKWKFVFIYGVLFMGGILTIPFGILILCQGDLPFRNQLLPIVLTGLIMCSIFGMTSGLMMWNSIQNTAQKESLLKNSSDDKK
jgi:hypothetical protein